MSDEDSQNYSVGHYDVLGRNMDDMNALREQRHNRVPANMQNAAQVIRSKVYENESKGFKPFDIPKISNEDAKDLNYY